jgi:hypothetical protein
MFNTTLAWLLYILEGGEEKDRATQILKTCLFYDENTDYR